MGAVKLDVRQSVTDHSEELDFIYMASDLHWLADMPSLFNPFIPSSWL